MSFRDPYPLGRVIPPDDAHIRKYPLRTIALPDVVESVLELPDIPNLRQHMDQGTEGACVGFSCSWALTLTHRELFTPRWLWDRAKEVDEWPETNPGDDNGTSVRAAFDVLRSVGHVHTEGTEPNPYWGITENRWGEGADDIRACIASGQPVVLGVNWYSTWDNPAQVGDEYWIGRGGDWGQLRGGHAIVCRGASDQRQAVLLTNTWGDRYPDVWVSYDGINRLMGESGEMAVITRTRMAMGGI